MNPAGYEKTGFSLDSIRSEWRHRAVTAGLEGGFLPDYATASSFLVNALYLFGDNAIAAFDGMPEGVTAELTRLGHRVATGALDESPPGGATSTGRILGKFARGRSEGRHDRAVLLMHAFGRGDDAAIRDRLRAMRRAVRPGGLICFHIFDRDKAWSLVGAREVDADGRRARVDIGFDPATGRLSGRLLQAEGPPGREDSGRSGFLAVKAWNRPELDILLRGAGLRLERVYAGWDGGPEADGRLIVVAAKPRRARRTGREGRRRSAPG